MVPPPLGSVPALCTGEMACGLAAVLVAEGAAGDTRGSGGDIR